MADEPLGTGLDVTVSDALYRRIASMDRKEKVLAGWRGCTEGFALPPARAAGVLDELVADRGFEDLHPVAWRPR
jgi:hypothetical protein